MHRDRLRRNRAEAYNYEDLHQLHIRPERGPCGRLVGFTRSIFFFEFPFFTTVSPDFVWPFDLELPPRPTRVKASKLQQSALLCPVWLSQHAVLAAPGHDMADEEAETTTSSSPSSLEDASARRCGHTGDFAVKLPG